MSDLQRGAGQRSHPSNYQLENAISRCKERWSVFRFVRPTARASRPPRPAGHAVMMLVRVRLEGACHLWRKIPSRQLSIDLVDLAKWHRSAVAGGTIVVGPGFETIREGHLAYVQVTKLFTTFSSSFMGSSAWKMRSKSKALRYPEATL